MEDEDTKNLLKEILKWEKFHGMQALRKTLPTVLGTDEKKVAYEMTNGKKSAREIEKATGISKSVVSKWWISWFSQGILVKEGEKYKKIVSLKDLGVELQKRSKNERTTI